MNDEVLMKVKYRVKDLQSNALDIAFSEELLIDVEHVHEMTQVHFAVLEDQEDAFSFRSNHDFLQVHDVRMRTDSLQLLQNVDFSQGCQGKALLWLVDLEFLDGDDFSGTSILCRIHGTCCSKCPTVGSLAQSGDLFELVYASAVCKELFSLLFLLDFLQHCYAHSKL